MKKKIKEESNELQFIKNFSSITITNVCKKLGIDRSNLLNNKSSNKKEILVKEEIMKEYSMLFKSVPEDVSLENLFKDIKYGKK